MLQLVLGLLAKLVSEEVLKEVFWHVILKGSIDIAEEFAKDSTNPYDDKFLKYFKQFIEKKQAE